MYDSLLMIASVVVFVGCIACAAVLVLMAIAVRVTAEEQKKGGRRVP